MRKLFVYADRYLERSSWKDLALVKFCLFSVGVLAGMRISEKNKKCVGTVAAAVFLATYVPLMAKFFTVVMEEDK